MNSNPTEISTNEPSVIEQKKGGELKRIAVIAVGVPLLVLLAAGGYFVGRMHGSASRQPAIVAENIIAPQTNAPDSKADEAKSGTHFVINAGVPFDLKKEVTASLALPIAVQAVQIDSNNNNRGHEQFFTNKYNDEIGRWTIGYPETPIGRDNQLSLLAIGDEWLKESQNVDGLFFIGAELNTPEQKADYLIKLKQDTDGCKGDSNKGFSLKDNVMNVCYSVTKSKYGEDGVLTLRGYGLLEKQQIILFGQVDLLNTKPETVNMWVASLSQTSITVKN